MHNPIDSTLSACLLDFFKLGLKRPPPTPHTPHTSHSPPLTNPMIIVVVECRENTDEMNHGCDHHQNVEQLMRRAIYIKLAGTETLGNSRLLLVRPGNPSCSPKGG